MANPLTYSDYINDTALIEALRIPQPPPAGQSADTWPMWQLPGQPGAGAAWSPGEPWPSGGNWRHDEVLFIRTHQAFEVWFALVLHELDSILGSAAEVCRARGCELPRVNLADRDKTMPSVPHAASQYPDIEHEADGQSDRAVAAVIRRLPEPARFHVKTELHLSWLAPDLLDLWTSRLHRAGAALATTVPFFRVLATLTPAQFLQFRGRLVPASGFGSVQFRELELTLGLREINESKLRPLSGTDQAEPNGPPLPPGMLRPTAATPPGMAANCFHRTLPPRAWPRVARREAGPSLRDLLYALVNARGLLWGDDAAMHRDIDAFAAHNVREMVRDWRQAAQESGPPRGGEAPASDELLNERAAELDSLLSHRENIVAARLAMRSGGDPRLDALGRFLEACLQLDEALLIWRDTHIRFVESMIGTRRGTGGGGLQYLRGTIDPRRGSRFTHVFPCLWYGRSLVQKPV